MLVLQYDLLILFTTRCSENMMLIIENSCSEVLALDHSLVSIWSPVNDTLLVYYIALNSTTPEDLEHLNAWVNTPNIFLKAKTLPVNLDILRQDVLVHDELALLPLSLPLETSMASTYPETKVIISTSFSCLKWLYFHTYEALMHNPFNLCLSTLYRWVFKHFVTRIRVRGTQST